MNDSNSCQWYDVFCWLGWLAEEIKLILVSIYAGIMDGVASFFASIPAPDFLVRVSENVPTIPPSVIWALNLFEVPLGITLVVSAYTLRFILRRIPFIG